MTRDSDCFVSLRARCDIANAQRDAVFISVHFNSAPRDGACGIETYYYGANAARFAASVHREVVRAAGSGDRHVRRRGFYVLRNTRIPAVLAECGFLTNSCEGGQIVTAGHRQKLANALASAIIIRCK